MQETLILVLITRADKKIGVFSITFLVIGFHNCLSPLLWFFTESSHLPTSSVPMFNMPVKKQIDDHDSHASDLSNCTQPTVEHPQ